MMENEARDKNCIRLPATNGPRPHRCEVCQRSFREVATLRKHEQLHRADRPYICTTCGKSFLWSSNLKVHERVHTGERPYKCKICHRCFTQSNDLRRHERNVHMRGKLYSYKTPVPRQAPAVNTGQMNLAAYQAFALQQRALLQHALSYESLMQNAAVAVTAPHFMPRPEHLHHAMAMTKQSDVTVTTSTPTTNNAHLHQPRLPPDERDAPFKIEQVTPPPDANSRYERGDNPSSQGHDDCYQSPNQSQFSPESNKAQSPQTLSSTTFGLQNGRHPSGDSHESHKDQRPRSNSREFPRFFNYPEDRPPSTDLPQTIHNSVYTHTHHNSENVIDLSMNKSLSSLDSDDGDWKHRNSSVLSSKSVDSESEDSKRHVTTTSATPTADSGIHHCPHCNIFFHDFTMYNLHQSLHSPVDEDPFLCPSCLKHCQDRIEFMFHIVWHVKYPHTIPKYQSFKESYLVSEAELDH